MVEGKSDEPLPDPVTDTVKLEDEVLITPQPPPDPDLPPDTPVPLVEVPPPEIRINKWHKVDPTEDEDSLETAECNQELLKGFYNVVRRKSRVFTRIPISSGYSVVKYTFPELHRRDRTMGSALRA